MLMVSFLAVAAAMTQQKLNAEENVYKIVFAAKFLTILQKGGGGGGCLST
jgi:hypothetical protein